MKNIAIIFLTTLILNSCNHKKDSKVIFSKILMDSIENEMIKYNNAKNENRYIIINFLKLPIFTKVENNNYLKTNSFELYKIYVRDYNKDFKRFSFFLNEITNNSLELRKKDFINKSFKLDAVIDKNFANFEIEDFLKLYSEKDTLTNKFYLNKKIDSENKYLTISYLLFTKSYYLRDNDLEGKSYIYKYPLVPADSVRAIR